LALATALSASAPTLAQAAQLISRTHDWTTYAHDGPPQKMCFAVAQPRASEPANLKRGKPFFYLTAWPKDRVKSEVSVKLGYPLKPGSEVMVTIGSAGFRLFVKDDKAFVANPAEELALIEAMKKGSTMIVQATSARGTATTDTYSLAGVGQALQMLAQKCR
jgi:hypothetical protein